MNEITKNNTTSPEAMGLVEVLDANGNPTGSYRAAGDGETPQEGTTFVTAEDGDHEVTVH